MAVAKENKVVHGNDLIVIGQEIKEALATKQDKLVSGTNIKTVNNTSLLGSGNVAVQPTLVSGTNIKTVNGESLLGSGNVTISKVGTDTVGASNRPIYLNAGTPTVTNPGEGFLSWGGQSISGGVTPIGMALSEEHSANKTAFINGDLITMEYSSDGGSTWTDYGFSESNKSLFFTTFFDVPIGRPNSSTSVVANQSKTRITLTAQNGSNPARSVYTNPKKLLICISSATSLTLLIESRTGTNYQNDGAWRTFGTYTVSGWSGWNDVPLIMTTLGGGSSQTGNNWQLRLTLTVTSVSSNYPTTAYVRGVRIFGENSWTTPSTLAKNGHLYSYDMYQNAIFPANVTASKIIKSGGTSSQFLKADGSVDSNSYATTSDLATKQNVISDLTTIRTGAAAGATAYQKPSAGIPLSDLSSSVQTSLGKADTALQSYTETDPTVPAWAKASTKPTYTASEVGALPSTTTIPSALSDLAADATHRTVTDTEKATWNAKQEAISDISTIRAGAAAGATAYQKPSTGIPSTDMTSEVQNTLELANTSASVALRKTAQTLTAAEKAQVWNNLGIKEGVSKVVSTLPTTEIDENIVYLVPTANAGEFTEYKYNGSSWDNLGTFTVQAPTVVNDLETGGSSSALSAEMGKILNQSINEIAKIPLFETEQSGFHIADESGRIALKYDEDGLDAAKISLHMLSLLSSGTFIDKYVCEVEETGLFFVDMNLNIGVKIDSDGLHAKNMLEFNA